MSYFATFWKPIWCPSREQPNTSEFIHSMRLWTCWNRKSLWHIADIHNLRHKNRKRLKAGFGWNSWPFFRKVKLDFEFPESQNTFPCWWFTLFMQVSVGQLCKRQPSAVPPEEMLQVNYCVQGCPAQIIPAKFLIITLSSNTSSAHRVSTGPSAWISMILFIYLISTYVIFSYECEDKELHLTVSWKFIEKGEREGIHLRNIGIYSW